MALLLSISSQQFTSVYAKAFISGKDLKNILYFCKQCSLGGTCTPLIYHLLFVLCPEILTVTRLGGRDSTVL